MKLKSISLGRVLGIPIALDFSWFLIFFLLTWTLAANVFPAEFPGWPVAQYWVVGAITAILLFASVLLHELGHSVVAIHYKIPVKRITLFIFGGVAQIGSEPPSANAEFWIAIAGPLVSFGLAAVFRLLQQVVGGLAPLLALATYLAYINATLALFNLIPGFPLDGGRVLRAILWGAGKDLSQATVIAANAGRLIAFLFMGFGLWQALVGNLANGLWIAFIGWFLHGAATSQLRQQALHDRLSGHPVAEIMRRSLPVVSAGTTLQYLVEHRGTENSPHGAYLVAEGERPVGFLTVASITAVPRERWPVTTTAQAMTSLTGEQAVAPSTDLWSAVQRMEQEEVGQLPVMQQERYVGMLTRDDIISFLRAQQAFRV